MKRKTIIQVWGRNGIGKSQTIKIAHQELIKRYVNPTHTYSLPFPPPDADISVYLTCLGFALGIDSMGDDLYYRYYTNPTLEERLNEFIITNKVDLLLCASRVYNNVNGYIHTLANKYGYRVLKVAPYIDEYGHFNRDEVNTAAAKNIVTLVDSILTGTL